MKRQLIFFASLIFAQLIIAQNVGVGTTNPAVRLDVQGDSTSTINVLTAKVNKTGLFDIPAIHGISRPAEGYGFGGIFDGGWYGAIGNAYGGNFEGTTYGLSGYAFGSAGTRIGIYGYAAGGTTNWAGYFDGLGLFKDDLSLEKNLIVNDTTFSSAVHSRTPYLNLNIEAGRDLVVKIDQPDDTLHAGAFWVRNGKDEEAFGVDENGNARTYGSHYIDASLGIGTQVPADRLHILNGNIRLEGLAPFHVFNSTLPTLPCGIHFNENNALEGALYYQADQNTLNLTNNFFDPGLVLDLNDNSVRIGGSFSAAGYKLSVDGKIMGEELRIMNSSGWPDYVFTENYDLMSLEELDMSIKQLGHLPGIPSASEILENGIEVGSVQKMLLEKIEELTLYILQQEKRIAALEHSKTK